MRKVINTVTTIVFVLVLIFVFLLVGIRIFGLKPYTVLSGSMEPEYHVGSLIYVKDTSVAELEVDMPITYRMKSGTVVTHRIVEINVSESDPTSVTYTTKGDANDDIDGTPVSINDIIGRPVFTIPLLGYVCHFIQNPPGSFITVMLLMSFIILAFLPDLIASMRSSGTQAVEQAGSEELEQTKKLISELSELRDGMLKDKQDQPPVTSSPPDSEVTDGTQSADGN